MSSYWKAVKVVSVPALMLAVVLAGCGGSSSGSTSNYESTSYSKSDDGWLASDAVTDVESASDYDSDDEYESYGSGYSPSQMLSQATSGSGGNINGDGTSYSAKSDDAEPVAEMPDDGVPEASEDLDSMIRRTADIELTTKKYDEADQTISDLVKRYSMVTLADNSSKNTSYYGSSTSYRTRHIKMRVKSEKFDEFCDAVNASAGVWDIEELNKSAEDVTKQYNDNAQQIDALRTRYDWYKQRIEQTQDEEVVRGYSDDMFDALEQISYLENVNNGIQTDVNYSVVAISLIEDVGTTATVNQSNDVWGDVGDELSVLPENISTVLGGLVLFLIRIIPTLIVLAILALIAWLVYKAYRNWRKKHPAKLRTSPAVMMVRNGAPVGQSAGQPFRPQQPMPIPRPMAQPAPAPATPQQPAQQDEGVRAAEAEVPVAMTDEALSEGAQVILDRMMDGSASDTGRMAAFDAISDEVQANIADSDEFADMLAKQEEEEEATKEAEEEAKRKAEEERRAAIRARMAQPVALADDGREPMPSPSMWDDVPDATYAKIDDLRDDDAEGDEAGGADGEE